MLRSASRTQGRHEPLKPIRRYAPSRKREATTREMREALLAVLPAEAAGRPVPRRRQDRMVAEGRAARSGSKGRHRASGRRPRAALQDEGMNAERTGSPDGSFAPRVGRPRSLRPTGANGIVPAMHADPEEEPTDGNAPDRDDRPRSGGGTAPRRGHGAGAGHGRLHGNHAMRAAAGPARAATASTTFLSPPDQDSNCRRAIGEHAG